MKELLLTRGCLDTAILPPLSPSAAALPYSKQALPLKTCNASLSAAGQGYECTIVSSSQEVRGC